MDEQQRLDNVVDDVTDLQAEMASVKTSVASIERTVTRLEDKFDQFTERLTELFVSRKEDAEAKKSVNERLERVESELKDVRTSVDADIRDLRASRGRLPPWGQALVTTLVAIVAAVVGHSAW